MHSLMEAALDPLVTISPAGRIIDVNTATENITGHRSHELVGTAFCDHFTSPADARRGFEDVLRDRRLVDYPLELQDDSGRITSVVCNAVAVSDEDDTVLGVFAAMHDVSSEIAARRRLQDSERRFRMLAENAGAVVLEADPNGLITWVAPTSNGTWGWTQHDLVGRSFPELLHPADRVEYAGIAASVAVPPVAREDRPSAGELLVRMRTDTGSYRWASGRLTGLFADSGDFAGLVVGLQDVDALVEARSEAEEAREDAERTRLSMDSAAIGMAITSPDGHFTSVNTALCRMLGYRREELQGRSFVELTHPDDVAEGVRAVGELTSGKVDSFTQRKRYRTRTGAYIWIDLSVAPVRNPDGALKYFVAQMKDVSVEVSNFEALQRTSQQYRTLAEHASDIVLRTDTQDTIHWVSPSISTVLGWDPDSLLGTRATALVEPADLPAVQQVRAAVNDGEAREVTVRCRTTDAANRVMSLTANPVISRHGGVNGAVWSLHDVTNEYRALDALAASEKQFRLALAGAPQAVALAAVDGRFIEVNESLCELLGATDSELLGRTLDEFMADDDLGVYRSTQAALQSGDARRIRHEHRLIAGDREVWVDHSVSLLRRPDDRPDFFVHHFADLTETRRLRAELEQSAMHDALTGLANRRTLMHQLTQRLELGEGTADEAGPQQDAADGYLMGVLFCDVDRLKGINDSYGHAGGDAVLAAVGQSLQIAVRSSDVVGRFGGDEFVVLLDRVDNREDLIRVAEKLQRSASRPVVHDGTTIAVTISVGATLAPPPSDPDEVLAQADAALYEAKRAGRNQTCIRVAEIGSP
jgi:diguanylate cyclase (GGDEF)-like protein/PAS domain S-box-containing protein